MTVTTDNANTNIITSASTNTNTNDNDPNLGPIEFTDLGWWMMQNHTLTGGDIKSLPQFGILLHFPIVT